jgi:EAL domain-containing protein (putative c-di-GMP-specific phosphodiesterase class I)
MLTVELALSSAPRWAIEKRANEQIRGLQKVGVKVALDDFGAGYSSLQYLHKFGFDKLKIDRGFIKELGAPNRAEGVETPEQLRILRDFGCHQIQGYLFSRPITSGRKRQPANQTRHFSGRSTSCLPGELSGVIRTGGCARARARSKDGEWLIATTSSSSARGLAD